MLETPRFGRRWRGRVLRRMTFDKTYMYCPPGYHRKRHAKLRGGVQLRHTHFRGRGEASGMDENERITLRLEQQNLELLHAVLRAQTRPGNRSELVGAAA